MLQLAGVERRIERVHERDAFNCRARGEVLAEHDGHLVQLSRRPDLRVVVRELVVPDAPDRLQHDGRGQWDDRERPFVEADLVIDAVRRDRRPEPEHGDARELGEGLSWERSRRTGRPWPTNAGEYIERAVLLVGVATINAVDEDVRVEEVLSHRYALSASSRSRR